MTTKQRGVRFAISGFIPCNTKDLSDERTQAAMAFAIGLKKLDGAPDGTVLLDMSVTAGSREIEDAPPAPAVVATDAKGEPEIPAHLRRTA